MPGRRQKATGTNHEREPGMQLYQLGKCRMKNNKIESLSCTE